MKKLTKKFIAVLMVLFATIAISASSLVAMAAVDNNIDFAFTIYAKNAISRDTNRQYRTTRDNNDAWKVNLRESSESTSKCGNYFCLSLEDCKVASKWQLVEKGSGTHYYAAYDDADNTYVYLMAKDNNNSSKVYQISGFWDEETGMTPDQS